MTYRLVNSAMMPLPGTYRAEAATEAEFVRSLRFAAKAGILTSYIGYEQTASFLARISGVPVAVSRAPTTLDDGDTLLVCRLRYRPQDPATKGKPVAEADFEFLVVRYSQEREAR